MGGETGGVTGGTSGATGRVAIAHHTLLTTLDVVRGTFVVGETLTEYTDADYLIYELTHAAHSAAAFPLGTTISQVTTNASGIVLIPAGKAPRENTSWTGNVDTVLYDRAGDLLLVDAVEDLGYNGKVKFFRNNIDHYTGATFGCHENYSMDRHAPLSKKNVLSLLAFQSMRVLFVGSGRVGSASEGSIYETGSGIYDNVPYQLSQRADYIHNDFFQWVQHNRVRSCGKAGTEGFR